MPEKDYGYAEKDHGFVSRSVTSSIVGAMVLVALLVSLAGCGEVPAPVSAPALSACEDGMEWNDGAMPKTAGMRVVKLTSAQAEAFMAEATKRKIDGLPKQYDAIHAVSPGPDSPIIRVVIVGGVCVLGWLDVPAAAFMQIMQGVSA